MSNLLSAQQGLLTAASYQGAAFSAINADFYVDGRYGFDGNPGTSPGLAFRTFTPLTYQLPLWRANNNYSQQIVVAFAGVVTQEWSTPRVNDVKIVGAGTQPRQAPTSGVANGGGATWLSPTSGAAALLQPNGQGWTVENIFFNNSATAAPCIQLVNAGDPPDSNCSEKFTLRNCILTGTDDGLHATDNPNHVLVEDNMFFGFSGAGDVAIMGSTGLGTGTLRGWRIRRNTFLGNANHIDISITGGEVDFNHFSYIYGGTTTTTQVVLTGGEDNSVHNNFFDLPYTTNGISAMFVLGTNDRWYFNQFATAVTTTIYRFGAPES